MRVLDEGTGFPYVFLALTLTLYAVVCDGQSLLPITAKGSKLFDNSGKQFFIKGMVYGNGSPNEVNDPLADPDQCALDAPLMQTLLVNTIRVYTVDNTESHDACMKSFSEHGIYVIISLHTPENNINSDQPTWTQSLFDAFTERLDAFAKYDNLLAVYVGTEIIREDIGSSSGDPQDAAPCIRAAARDIKAYRDAQLYRQIPVGYASNHIGGLDALRDYLACGSDNSSTVDFFSYNQFSWCGSDGTFSNSNYSTLYETSLDYPVPLFFSETGCNTNDRIFDDQVAVLGPQMNSKWSGAIIYEWPQQENEYGIVHYSGSSFASTGTPTPISPDFYNLQSQWDTLTPTGVALHQYTPPTTTLDCPTSTAGGWTVDAGASLPVIKNLVIPSKTVESGTTATITPAPETGTTPESTASPTATTSPSRNNQTPGLPKGAKIAIGVVIPLAVLAVMIIAFFIYRRRKETKRSNPTNYSEVQQSADATKPELHSDSRATAQLPSDGIVRELDGAQRYQLYDEVQHPSELHGTHPPQEMSTSASVRRTPGPRS